LARVLSTAFLVALLAATAAAFALTEGAKLELSPIYGTTITNKVFSPGITAADIDFRLRKSDHVTVWMEHDGQRVAQLTARTYKRGKVSLVFEGIGTTGLTLPEGKYIPVVHLGRSHRTIRLPSSIELDTTPPVITVPHRIYTHISPDGDGHHDSFRVDYKLDGPARAMLFVGRRRVWLTHGKQLRGQLIWNGKFGTRPARPGNYELRVAAQDPARNVSKLGIPFAIVTVRYIALGRTRIVAKPGTRFALRVLTDAPCVDWRMDRGHRRVCHHTLKLRAPRKPGVYRLYVQAAGHAAKALVVVA
jgi:hypothetical protein